MPRTGHAPSYRGILESLTQLGPIARRVEDLALLLPIIAGPDGIDPHIAPVPLRDPAEVGVRSLRVAWFDDDGRHRPTPRSGPRSVPPPMPCATRAPRSASGCHPTRAAPRTCGGPRRCRRARLAALPIAAAGTPGAGSYEGRADWATGSTPLAGDDLTALVEAVDDVRSDMLRWMADVDLIVSPVLPDVARPHGDGWTDAFQDGYSEVHNLTGWPAAVVRGGTSPEGLPIGVQLIAAPWREDWRSRRPAWWRPPSAGGSRRHCEIRDRIASGGDQFLLRSARAAGCHPPRLGHVHPHRRTGLLSPSLIRSIKDTSSRRTPGSASTTSSTRSCMRRVARRGLVTEHWAGVVLTLASAFVGIGLALMALAPGWELFLLAALPTGLGVGALDGGMNGLVSISPDRPRQGAQPPAHIQHRS